MGHQTLIPCVESGCPIQTHLIDLAPAVCRGDPQSSSDLTYFLLCELTGGVKNLLAATVKARLSLLKVKNNTLILRQMIFFNLKATKHTVAEFSALKGLGTAASFRLV